MPYKPLYITVEGLDGCGKTTAVEIISEWMNENSVPFKKVSMLPQGKLRDLILHEDTLTPWQRVACFATAAQFAYREIDDALSQGSFVIADRGIDSFYAYQGFGEGLLDKVEEMRRYYGDYRNPDLTFYIQASINTCRERMKNRGSLNDSMESRDDSFFESVLEGFEHRLQTTSHMKVIDGENKPKRVALDITLELDMMMENLLA